MKHPLQNVVAKLCTLILVGLSIAFFAVAGRAQSYPCGGGVYFTSYDNTNVYRYTSSTNAITAVAGYSITAPSAASAVTPDGTRLYYADNGSDLRYNTGGTSNFAASLNTMPSTSVQRMGIAPDGTGYLMDGVAGSLQYYKFTTGGATSTVTGPFTLALQPSTAPAIGRGGDIAFDGSGIGYIVDQSRNLYRLDFTNNVINYLSTISGITTGQNPNGMGFSQTITGTYELYLSTLSNTLYRLNLATSTATLVTPSSTVGGFTQNDIASCVFPASFLPNVNAVKAWRNVTKGDPATFATSTSPNVGDTLEYRVVVRNTGLIAAGGVTFQDTIPSGLVYTASTTTLNGVAVTDNAGTGNAAFAYGTAKTIQGYNQLAGSGLLLVDTTPGTINDNEAVVTFRVTVTNPFTGTANPVLNTAVVNYAGAAAPVNSNTTSTTVLLPDLRIAKTHTGSFTRGSTGVYTITVTNAGTASTAGTITVTDNLPAGLSVNGGAAASVSVGNTNWTCVSNNSSPQTITCNSIAGFVIPSTSGSNTSVLTLTVNVATSAASSVTNNVSVAGGGEPALNNGNNTASDPTTTVGGAPLVTLVKSCTTLVGSTPTDCGSVNLSSGMDMTYTIAFTNTGGQSAVSFSVIDPNPANATLKLNNNTDFKVGSVASVLPTGLTGVTVAYSNDSGATYAYTPVSLGGGAPAGYDRNVTHVRWSFTGALSQTSPNNTGNVSFLLRIR